MELSKPIQQAFRYCPRCATEADPVGDIPFRCDQCGFAFFFGPVTAVGGIMQDRQGNMLLIERGRDPGKGKYGLPGGFVDHHETAEGALRREVREEVGLEIETIQYLTTLPNQYNYQGLTAAVLDLFFVCHVESYDDIVADPHEVAQCWIGIPGDQQLNAMAFESNKLAMLKYLANR
jgi:ADP-ribose pyrophosphatase YjhB (NUDIX family)